MTTPRDYDLRTFARRAANNAKLLEELAQSYGMTLSAPKGMKTTKDVLADAFVASYDNLDEAKRDKVNKETIDIFEIGSGGGGFTILHFLAKDKGITLPDELEDWNNCGKAIWFFLNQREIFDDAFDWFGIESRNGWREAVELKRVSVNDLIDKENTLADALKVHYRNLDLTGRNCVVKRKELDNRVCFRAFIEGQATDTEIFKGDKLTTTDIMKPANEAIFIYYPNEGRLRIRAVGGKDEIEKLRDIFRKIVLNDTSTTPVNDRVFNLDILKNVAIPLPTQPEDQVEGIRVFELTINNKFARGEYTILRVDKASSKEAVYNLAKERGIDFSKDKHLSILGAKIYVKFAGKGNRGGVTVQLGWPNSSNLEEKPLHNKVKAYLKTWGIDYDSSIETAP